MAGKELKVVRVLRTLEPRDLDRLEDFLDAAYFVSDKVYLEYFRGLKVELIKGSLSLDAEVIFRELFPEEFNPKFSRINSNLLQLVYRFISVEYLAGDELRQWGTVVAACNNKFRTELVDIVLPGLERSLERAPDSLERANLNYKFLEITASKPEGFGRQTKKIPNSKVIRALDDYYQLARLRLECAMLTRESVLGKEEISGTVLETEEEGALIHLYGLVRKNLQAPAEKEHCAALVAALEPMINGNSVDKFSPEFQEIYTYVLNGCIRLVNLQQGRKDCRELLRRVYWLLLESKVLLDNGLLSPWHFKNLIQNQVMVGEFEQARSVIDNYGGKLKDDYHNNAVNYAEAYLNFHQGAFEDSLKFIHSLLQDYKDVYYGLDGRTILLRCQVELKDIEQLESHGEAFRLFLHRLSKRKSISEDYRNLYADFLKNITALGKILFGSPDRVHAKAEKFVKRIEAQANILHREWLLNKARGLTEK